MLPVTDMPTTLFQIKAKGSDQSVNTFVPGHEQESIPVPSSLCYGASQFVPGQQMKQGGITITGLMFQDASHH